MTFEQNKVVFEAVQEFLKDSILFFHSLTLVKWPDVIFLILPNCFNKILFLQKYLDLRLSTYTGSNDTESTVNATLLSRSMYLLYAGIYVVSN